ncbi:hypothetical protein SAMN05216191_110211 [Paenibacillus jilunlii]|uniref:Uncharacterized protein n=1 Tax=Paenibacillus jilunlii TaxID=682956 RepID=A0A1G9RQ99_9BACL|nr:hypothetical protein SAMN05216191_110211 [Paenibacillus jilunlii]
MREELRESVEGKVFEVIRAWLRVVFGLPAAVVLGYPDLNRW